MHPIRLGLQGACRAAARFVDGSRDHTGNAKPGLPSPLAHARTYATRKLRELGQFKSGVSETTHDASRRRRSKMTPPQASSSYSSSAATFEFVVGNRPDQLKGLATSRLRSHVSKRGWQAHLAVHHPTPPPQVQQQQRSLASSSSSSSSSPAAGRGGDPKADARERRRRRRRAGKPVSVTYELAATSLPLPAPPANGDGDGDDNENASATLMSLLVPRHRPAAAAAAAASPPALLFDPLLGGTRVDPFRAYPGPWHPDIPAWTDNCEFNDRLIMSRGGRNLGLPPFRRRPHGRRHRRARRAGPQGPPPHPLVPPCPIGPLHLCRHLTSFGRKLRLQRLSRQLSVLIIIIIIIVFLLLLSLISSHNDDRQPGQ
ncbi:hypothetical protein JDV02_000706 [Purpureocillium takamizusanense]|uniref:Uncharacterized protein n=1 Tax=Purpureocillium takamizusanense TaxID=2060973 RepID=A0A9Q8Q6M2_9HYPO|nr:uncharacterized protein JDV02_000706 [Purpureocillium takamizusanense]UNI14025.1 hypothetical protein JDV02_000706 [Purpureocillium takamizusanense]